MPVQIRLAQSLQVFQKPYHVTLPVACSSYLSVFVQGEVAPNWKAVLEVQPRVHAEGMSRLVLRPQVQVALGDGWSVGGGYGAIAQYSDEGVAWEHRIFEQGANETQFASFKWSNRSRLEQRFLPDADQVSLRWRQQTKATVPLAEEIGRAHV